MVFVGCCVLVVAVCCELCVVRVVLLLFAFVRYLSFAVGGCERCCLWFAVVCC